MQINLLSSAENDITLGMDFYEAQVIGLGCYFSDAILSDISSLSIYAGIHLKVNGYHRLLSKRFPFSIYYKLENNAVYVYAILDCRQNPDTLQKRLRSDDRL